MMKLDPSLDYFNARYDLICKYIEDGQNDLALTLLGELYEQYKPILGDKQRDIIHCKFVLAQLTAEAGDISKAKVYFDTSIKEIKCCSDFEGEFVIETQMTYARFLISVNDYIPAISVLKELKNILEKDIEHNKKNYLAILDLLASLYSVENEHRKSVDLSCELLYILTEDHSRKYGNVLSRENIDFDEQVLDKVISLYLGIGASLSRMEEFNEAKQYFEKGYFIAFTAYGDEDERTLKLNYDIAVNEMQGMDQREGIRQLHFVYKDMAKYLGSDSKYTKKAYDVLKSMGESP